MLVVYPVYSRPILIVILLIISYKFTKLEIEYRVNICSNCKYMFFTVCVHGCVCVEV